MTPVYFTSSYAVLLACPIKDECKGQASIQPSTTPNPGHHMGKW